MALRERDAKCAAAKRFIEAHAMITAMGEQTGDTDLFLCDVGAKLLERVVKAPPASSIQKGKSKRQKSR